jgi:hypothetical protein
MGQRTKSGIYDFGEVLLLIKHKLHPNMIKIDGFAKDSEITVEREERRWTRNGSGDGKATTFVRNPDTSGTITFSLNQSTDSLDKMNAICAYADTARSLNMIFETTLVDKSSRTVYYSPESLASYPESLAFGQTESDREFVIECGDLQETLGGSSKISPETLAVLEAFDIQVDDSWKIMI